MPLPILKMEVVEGELGEDKNHILNVNRLSDNFQLKYVIYYLVIKFKLVE